MPRKLVYFVAVTLDGFIAGPDRGDPSGTPYFPVPQDLIEFLVDEYPETLPAPARQALGIEGLGKVFDTVLEGRVSYDVGRAAGLTNAYPHLRHIVFSTSMTTSPDPSVEVAAADPAATARTLKAEDGRDIWIVGGGTLAHALLPEIDRLILKQHPTVIGSGAPLFDDRSSHAAFTCATSAPSTRASASWTSTARQADGSRVPEADSRRARRPAPSPLKRSGGTSDGARCADGTD